MEIKTVTILRIDDSTFFCIDTNTRFIFDSFQGADKRGKQKLRFVLFAENVFDKDRVDRVVIAEHDNAVRLFKQIRQASGWPPDDDE